MKNPFLLPYSAPFEAIPFDKIKLEHYLPAFEEGMKQGKVEIENIKKASPAFHNTMEALERSGK